MPLWIPITIAAAFFQNLRSGLQKRLKRQMRTTGATFVRFGFGLPFALVYLVVVVQLSTGPVPLPNGWVVLAAASGGLAQIGATFLLVYLFGLRNFMVGTAYSKTEPVQAALFGFLILGDTVSPLGLLAVAAGVVGVILISVGNAGSRDIVRGLASRAALIGVGSGALFGISAVCFRAAALALGSGEAALRAAVVLVLTLAIQSIVMLLWMAIRDRSELRRVANGWRPGLLVGLSGASASAGWFTAMTLQNVAYVRALGQIELIFTLASSLLWFRERITRLELAGAGIIVLAIFALIGGT
ncbi:DMT family transporter [Jiella sp. MQZ9-1]|uniref:EamA family transporter n=1 Tax=Jiella flava TaxID=2816857 RepID=A0A939FVH9_9HYPH|nr:DMT family transporter [Jiella flava]MBO0662723.1 EamA family transporter [Jiella flava]MCD2471145.1 DMT family transporter [Jiella flava]